MGAWNSARLYCIRRRSVCTASRVQQPRLALHASLEGYVECLRSACFAGPRPAGQERKEAEVRYGEPSPAVINKLEFILLSFA